MSLPSRVEMVPSGRRIRPNQTCSRLQVTPRPPRDGEQLLEVQLLPLVGDDDDARRAASARRDRAAPATSVVP